MATGRPVGTMFAEIDLDSTKIEQGLKRVHDQLVNNTVKTEDAYKNLGIKSDQVYAMMRDNAIQSLEYIKTKTLSSKEEIIRAEQAAAAKIKQIDTEMHGNRTSMIDSIKKNWLVATAAMAAASMAASQAWNMLDKAAEFERMNISIDKMAKGFGSSSSGLVAGIKEASTGLISVENATKMAGEAMIKGFDPKTLTQFAAAAKTLAAYSGETAEDVFTKLVESITTGRERAIKKLVGIMELENRYSKDQIENMTDLEKAHAKANMVFERTAEIQHKMGSEFDYAADKIERQKIKMQDLHLQAGQRSLEYAKTALNEAETLGGMFEWLGTRAYDMFNSDAKTGTPKIAVSHGKTTAPAATPKLSTSHGAELEATKKALADIGTEQKKVIEGAANWEKANQKLLTSTQDVLKVYEQYLGKGSSEYLALREVVNKTTIELEDKKIKSLFEMNLVEQKKVTQSELDEYNGLYVKEKKLTTERTGEISRLLGTMNQVRNAQRFALEQKFLSEVKDATLSAQEEIKAAITKSWADLEAQKLAISTAAANKAYAAWQAAEGASQVGSAASMGWTFNEETGQWDRASAPSGGPAASGSSINLGTFTGLPVGPGSGGSWKPMSGIGSYASGTDYVPRTGLYQLHQGEKVIPAGGSGMVYSPNIYITGVNDPGELARQLVKPMAQELRRLAQIVA